MTTVPDSRFSVRRAEIAANLERLNERIEAGCAAAGRMSCEVTLIAVTKTYPASDLQVVASLGIRDVGENRAQELVAKRGELGLRAARLNVGPEAARLNVGPEAAPLNLVWHFIGQVQSNKAGDVVANADMIHSVDRPSLIAALAKAAAFQDRSVDCLIQVGLDGVPGRGGAPPDQVLALAELIASTSHLRVRGLMAVAPLGGDARAAFSVLPALSERVRTEHPGADVISAGMSGDLEAALAEQTTHLRVGTGLLGLRS